MSLIVFKLVLPPLLILLGSLAARRWGGAIGGWLVGLPLTSGPVAAFLAIQYGPEFAARATNGSLIGAAAQACFSLAYALLASRGAAIAVIGGTAAYTGASFLILAWPLPLWGCFAVALATLIAAIRWIPHRAPLRAVLSPPWWDLPARMALATALVVALTAAAAVVGPRGAGVLASFPVFGIILTVFAHRMKGPAMATQVLRGMVFALFGFAAFFFALGSALPQVGVLPAFLAALAAGLLAQAAALRLIRRGRAPTEV